MNEKITPKYIDPMVDFGFKKIFKESGKQQLIIRPLNAIFGLDITDIDIRESEQLGLSEQERRATYDMFCTSRSGESFIIEVQLSAQAYFAERAIFYSARTVSRKAQQGEWDYNFAPVFFLGFLNFDFPHLPGETPQKDQFIYRFSLREDETHEQMSRALRFAFLEVARFDKPKEECVSFEDRFLFMMKNLPTFAEQPELWDDPYFEEMMKEAEFANMTFEEQEAYIASMKVKWDNKNTIDYAHAKGKEEGRAEGRAEGKAEGRAEGKIEERRETALRMLADQLPVEAVAKYTGLSVEQVKALL